MLIEVQGVETHDDYVQLQDVKDMLRVDDDADDLLIETLIHTAVDYCASYIGYPLNNEVYTMSVTGYDGDGIDFPSDPRREYSVLSVQAHGLDIPYTFEHGVLTLQEPVADFEYRVRVSPVLDGRRFITSACYLLIGKLYEQRGDEAGNLTAGGWRSINALLDLAARRTV